MKLVRHAADGEFDAPVVLVQVFSGYYDVSGGDVSSNRENAEFVGSLAEESVEGFDYHAVDLEFTPPVRGSDAPANWRGAVADAAADIDALL